MDKISKQILYFDMDGVLVNFASGIAKLDDKTKAEYEDRLDEVPGIFGLMEPMKGAVESFKLLSEYFDTYILTTSPWDNPTAPSDKIKWVKHHIGDIARKRVIFSHHKNLSKGDYLIDDRVANGSDKFEGEHIHFGQAGFENWEKVVEYLLTENRL